MSRIPSILLGVVLLAGSISGILLETRYKGDAKAEAFFCRYLLCSNDLLQTRAYEKLAAGGEENLQQSIRLFEQVLDRDKVNPYRWCDLGDALTEAGRNERAQSCFRKALELGPNIPAILMRAANFYFRIDDARNALPQTSHVLRMVPDYDQVVFSSYTRMNLPASAVLAGGIPEDKRAGQAYLRYLLSNGAAVADAERGWEWLGARSFTDDALAAAYLDFLVHNHGYGMASAAWAKYLGKRRGDYLQPNRMFNGGFESEFTPALFDWRITPVEGVEVERDSAGPQSGKYCLRLQFAGQTNLDYSQTKQSVHAAPGTYRFQAFMKSEEISTDKGVGLRIFDAVSPGRLDIRTEPFLGTHDWTRVDAAITVPADTILNIQVVRPSSLKFDCKIKGTVWLDAVSLRQM